MPLPVVQSESAVISRPDQRFHGCRFGQVNPVREKKLSNVRTTAADEKIFLTAPRTMTLEDAIGAVQRTCLRCSADPH